jgi:hypothetical protein
MRGPQFHDAGSAEPKESEMQKLMIITAVVRVHPRHSQGWLKDNIQEKLADFAPVKHLTVEEYQDTEEDRG